VDLRDLDPAAWRASLAWVPQHPRLFAASIAENIALGLDVPEESVREAAAAMEADGFITALPRGYATVLDERATVLSSGQRQRLALARALLRDAPFVLLDEPTAHLDPATESVLLSADPLFADRTVLLVAHRPALLSRADRIIRLPGTRQAVPASRKPSIPVSLSIPKPHGAAGPDQDASAPPDPIGVPIPRTHETAGERAREAAGVKGVAVGSGGCTEEAG